MKIVVVYGQNNKGNTHALTHLLLAALNKEAQTLQELFPSDYVKDFCTGCTSCFYNGENTCPHAGLVQPVWKQLEEADLLVFSSSCYVMQMTACMKNLLDHFAYRFMSHRPSEKMFAKQAVVFTTAAGAGMGKAAKSIADSLFYWGVPVIHRYSLPIAAASFEAINEKRKAAIQKDFRKLAHRIENQHHPKPGIKSKALFLIMRRMQIGNDWNPKDREYWQANGWLGNTVPY